MVAVVFCSLSLSLSSFAYLRSIRSLSKDNDTGSHAHLIHDVLLFLGDSFMNFKEVVVVTKD